MKIEDEFHQKAILVCIDALSSQTAQTVNITASSLSSDTSLSFVVPLCGAENVINDICIFRGLCKEI